MQIEYLLLGDKSVENGRYLLAVFKIIPADGLTLEDVATEIAAESSTGTSIKVGSSTPFSVSNNAKVYEIDEQNNLVWIAYPWEIFDSGGNIQNILTYIAGNIFGVSEVKACKLLDVYFPPEMLCRYDGPNYTLDDMRGYLNVWDKPILGSIIKPKIGLTPTQYAELAYDFWVGGGHFVKNDEPQADQSFCPFKSMVDSVRIAMDRAEQITGEGKVHSFNVSAPDYDTMIQRADYVASVMKPGSYAYLIDGITAGWMAVQTLRRHYPDTFLHFHRAGHGAFTREENPIGFSVEVLTKFARLAGASGIHTGTAGVGKMSGDSRTDITAAHQALRLQSQGLYFNQVWSKISEKDTDISQLVEKEENRWKENIKDTLKERKELKRDFYFTSDTARIVPKTTPIISGGLNPTLLAKFLDTMGTIDFITTMGAGVHSHPKGTQAGAKAVLQAYDAWKEGIDIQEYAKDHEELALAIDFFEKNKTNTHKAKPLEDV
ncbi:ribulose-bisphosphate carboxylase [Candidatus Microgenomates bacterium]|nr:ribulose-bisphosphate carboxylase [Candidatus Microgenomates bacterium]